MLLVAAGGAAGSVCRYGATLLGTRLLGPAWPLGTFFVNVTGSFLMGVLVELLLRRLGGSDPLRLLLATGFLGGYTTFSSFTLDAVSIWERGEGVAALGYVLASVVLGVLAVIAGMVAVRQFA